MSGSSGLSNHSCERSFTFGAVLGVVGHDNSPINPVSGHAGSAGFGRPRPENQPSSIAPGNPAPQMKSSATVGHATRSQPSQERILCSVTGAAEGEAEISPWQTLRAGSAPRTPAGGLRYAYPCLRQQSTRWRRRQPASRRTPRPKTIGRSCTVSALRAPSSSSLGLRHRQPLHAGRHRRAWPGQGARDCRGRRQGDGARAAGH